jgi:hypothetical protein
VNDVPKIEKTDELSVATAQELVANCEQRYERADVLLTRAAEEAHKARIALNTARRALAAANRREINRAKGA